MQTTPSAIKTLGNLNLAVLILSITIASTIVFSLSVYIARRKRHRQCQALTPPPPYHDGPSHSRRFQEVRSRAVKPDIPIKPPRISYMPPESHMSTTWVRTESFLSYYFKNADQNNRITFPVPRQLEAPPSLIKALPAVRIRSAKYTSSIYSPRPGTAWPFPDSKDNLVCGWERSQDYRHDAESGLLKGLSKINEPGEYSETIDTESIRSQWAFETHRDVPTIQDVPRGLRTMVAGDDSPTRLSVNPINGPSRNLTPAPSIYDTPGPSRNLTPTLAKTPTTNLASSVGTSTPAPMNFSTLPYRKEGWI